MEKKDILDKILSLTLNEYNDLRLYLNIKYKMEILPPLSPLPWFVGIIPIVKYELTITGLRREHAEILSIVLTKWNHKYEIEIGTPCFEPHQLLINLDDSKHE